MRLVENLLGRLTDCGTRGVSTDQLRNVEQALTIVDNADGGSLFSFVVHFIEICSEWQGQQGEGRGSQPPLKSAAS